MSLTDSAVRNAKTKAKQYKLADERGLYLLVKPNGSRLWRLKYRLHGKEQLYAIGPYPTVSLKDAREAALKARKEIGEGKHPLAEDKRREAEARSRAANTFQLVAEEYITKRELEGLDPVTVAKARWYLRFLSPLWSRPVSEIEAYELLEVVKALEATGKRESAARVLSFASRVFRFAVVTARAKRDPAADLRGALISPTVKHHAAILEPKRVGELLRAIDGCQGQPSTIYALRLAPHVFVRPRELRQAEWSELDLEGHAGTGPVWRIPAGRMKMDVEHVVPLSRQAVEILKDAKKLTGGGKYVFPSVRTSRRPLSENTLNVALRRIGYGKDEMTSHGFRSTASTLLNESGRWSPDAIERALAHKSTDAVRGAYHRGSHWQERVEMAQWWSDYLDTLRAGGEVIPFRFKSGA